MEINATQSTTATTVSADETGFNALSSEDFLEMMIVQLQNQDPLEPTGNEELLNQISQMRSLQSGVELSEVLQTFSSQQQLTSAASLLGKDVTGTTTNPDGTTSTVEGVVERAFIIDGEALVGLPSGEIPVSAIRDVR